MSEKQRYVEMLKDISENNIDEISEIEIGDENSAVAVDVEQLIVAETEKLEKFLSVGQKYFYFEDGKDLTEVVRQQTNELFAKLQKGPLTTDEFNKLVNLATEMNFNETVRNTVDLGYTACMANIETFKNLNTKKAIFKPIVTKFSKKMQQITENKNLNIDDQIKEREETQKQNAENILFNVEETNKFLLNIIKDEDYEQISAENFSMEEFEKLVDRTADASEKFYDLEAKCTESLMQTGSYNLNDLKNKEAAWNDFSANLFECIEEYQLMHLKNCYEKARDYLFSINSDGTLLCKVGDKFYNISRNNIVDDMAKLSNAVTTFENVKTIEEKPKEETVSNNEIIEEPDLEEVQNEVNPEIEAYTDFVMAHMDADRNEVIERASDPAILEGWINSPLSLNAYNNALENGEISEDVSYDEYKNMALENTDTKEETKEPDLASELEEVSYEERPIDLSGLDVSIYDEAPYQFSNETRPLGDIPVKSR